MKNRIQIDNFTILIIFVAALLNFFIHYLNIDSYTKNITIPFTIMLGTYIILLRDHTICNRKAYYLLIPIFLILASDIFLNIDGSNMFLNMIILPILFSMLFFLLTNKNYRISSNVFAWVFPLFFENHFSNLRYLKEKIFQEKNKSLNIFLGVLIGGFFGIVILSLLMSADDYFKAFIDNTVQMFHFDFSGIIIFFLSFVLLFSIFINILLNRNKKIKKTTYQEVSETMVITILVIINVVFILFLISEISRLTTNFLQLPVKYTYSSYAREGFFQLLIVTVINFGIIMYLLYKTTIIKNSKNIKNLILVLIAFSIVLIFNSYYRMFLYIDNYGFTILRLQVILFLAMELVLFIVLIKKLVSNLKYDDAIIYFIVIISFYIVNLYLCTNRFIQIINNIY